MTLANLYSLGYNDIVLNTDEINTDLLVERTTNGSDIYVGMIVSENGETFDDIDLAVSGDGTFLGVVRKIVNPADVPENWNIGVAIPDDTKVEVVLPHGGKLKMVGFVSPKASNANNISGNETLSVSAETGGDGLLDVGDNGALNVGKAISGQSITVGTSDNEAVLYRY